jgi:hypothetical protein
MEGEYEYSALDYAVIGVATAHGFVDQYEYWSPDVTASEPLLTTTDAACSGALSGSIVAGVIVPYLPQWAKVILSGLMIWDGIEKIRWLIKNK